MSARTKTCNGCGNEYPATMEYFHVDNNASSGLKARCKRCRTKESLQWQMENPEKRRMATRKWKRANPEKVRDGNRKRREAKGIRPRHAERVSFACLTCGAIFLDRPSVNRKYCSLLCAAEGNRPSRTGENNPYWTGNKRARIRLMGQREYKEWRTLVFERDEYSCQDCGEKHGHNLHAHHIFPFAQYPEHRLEVWNGITLCIHCHSKHHPNMAAMRVCRERNGEKNG